MGDKTFRLEEIEAAIEDYNGFCTDCGAEMFGVEPDARDYICEECNKPAVYGAEELVIMGRVS